MIRPKFECGSAYVLTNIGSGKHLRISPDAYRVANMLNGRHSLADIVNNYPDLGDEGVKNIIAMFANYGFIRTDHANKEPTEPVSEKSVETRVMSSRHPLMDANQILTKFGPLISWLYSLPGFLIWCAVLLAAGYSLLTTLVPPQSIESWLQQISLTDGLIFSVLIFIAKLFHEMGHATALQRMAHSEGFDPGPIRIGLTRFFFFFLPFTDASAGWQVSSKWRRTVIALGGVYIEILLAALGVLVASQVESELLKALLYQFAFIAAISTLIFNLNPFIKLDGYYIVTDILDFQNLQGRSIAAITSVFGKLFFRDSQTNAYSGILVAYALGSFFFRCLILFGIAVAGSLISPILGAAVLLIAFSTIVVRPLLKFIKNNSGRKLSIQGALVLGCICVLPLMPVHKTVTVSGHVENETLVNLIPPPGSFISQQDMDKDRLNFSNIDLDHETEIATLQAAIVQNEYRAAVASRSTHRESLRDAMLKAQENISRLNNEKDRLEINNEKFEIFIKSDFAFMNNQILANNTPVGVMMDTNTVRVRLFVPEFFFVENNRKKRTAKIKIWNDANLGSVETQTTFQNWTPVLKLPSASLTRKFDGKIVIDPDSIPDLIPAKLHFSDTVSLPPDSLLHRKFYHGERVVAVISDGWSILGREMWNMARKKFTLIFDGDTS
ncbi:MAG: M50 family metallopeptidase [Pseudomonadota bacterium]